MAAPAAPKGGAWFVAYSFGVSNGLSDYWEPVPNEEAARTRYAELVNTDGVYCACIGPIVEATEPHWLVEGGI